MTKQTNLSTSLRDKKLKEIRMLKNKLRDFGSFSKNATNIRIYIDESWPALNNEKKELNVGVISGIVWIGLFPDKRELPFVGTHKQGNPQALLKLLKCENAMPFIMPIKSLKNNAMKNYIELVEATVKILLGWLLPQQGKKCNVQIFAEHIGEFVDKTDKTEHFQGMLKQAAEQNKNRFARFSINNVGAK